MAYALTHATDFGNVVSCSTKCGVKIIRMWCQDPLNVVSSTQIVVSSTHNVVSRSSKCVVKILRMWCQGPQNVVSSHQSVVSSH